MGLRHFMRAAEELQKMETEAEEKAKKEAEDRLNNPTQEELLKDIRDLLKAQQVAEIKVEDANTIAADLTDKRMFASATTDLNLNFLIYTIIAHKKLLCF